LSTIFSGGSVRGLTLLPAALGRRASPPLRPDSLDSGLV
jgi:hypothetical protein